MTSQVWVTDRIKKRPRESGEKGGRDARRSDLHPAEALAERQTFCGNLNYGATELEKRGW